MKFYFRYFFILVTLPFLLTNCSSCNKSTASIPTIRLSIESAPEILDPRFASSAVASRISELIYGRLFIVDNDLKLQPFMAKAIKQIGDLKYILTLKDNLYFHDGTKLSAHDVAYTFSSLSDEDVASPVAAKFDYVKSIVATNDITVEIELNKPFAAFLLDLAAVGIVSKAKCQNRSRECKLENIGAGPFKLANFDSAKEKLLLVPNAKWGEGAPKVNLEIQVIRDDTTRLLELISGKTDFVSGDIRPNQVEKVLENEDKLVLHQTPGLGYNYLAINLRKSSTATGELKRTQDALGNSLVRQAMARALNIDQVLQSLWKGYAKRASGLIPNGHWAKDPGLKPIAYDPQAAQNLLDEAGFKDRGAMQHRRFQVNIVTTPNRFRQSVIQVFADQLRAVGIEVHLQVKEWSALYQDMQQGNFELFSAVWTPVVDPELFYWVFHSNSIPGPDKAGGNRVAYSSAMVDKWIEQTQIISDSKERAKLVYQIENQLAQDLPYIPLWFADEIVVHSKRILNFKPTRTGSLLGLREVRVGQ